MNSVILIILLVPIIEIYLFIKIGSQIGAFNTIALIIITAIFGLYYAKYEGLNTLKSGIQQIVKNELPLYEIISGAALAFAALLMIIPGFLTDIIGGSVIAFVSYRLRELPFRVAFPAKAMGHIFLHQVLFDLSVYKH